MASRTRFLPDWAVHRKPAPRTPEHGARYEIPSAAQVKLGLWVSAAGYSTANTGMGTRNRILGTYAAVLVLNGRLRFESPPTGRLECGPGTLVWLFPKVPHSYGGLGGPFGERWILFGGRMAEAWERLGVLSPARPFVDLTGRPEIPQGMTDLHEAFFAGGPLAIPTAAAILHRMVVAAHGLATGLHGPAEQADAVVAEAIAIIEKEAILGLVPERLAARLHVGYSTLRRRFKAVTGYALKEYILRVQLRRAKELLAFTEMPLEQLAAACGYDDPFYFSRLFKARVGVAPSHFRRQEARHHG